MRSTAYHDLLRLDKRSLGFDEVCGEVRGLLRSLPSLPPVPPAAEEPLVRPPASWAVPWDLHSDFLQLAFPFPIIQLAYLQFLIIPLDFLWLAFPFNYSQFLFLHLDFLQIVFSIFYLSNTFLVSSQTFKFPIALYVYPP